MLFTSFEFVFLFVPATLVGFMLLRGANYAASVLWLVTASLFFYAFWNAAYLWLLVPSIVVNFFLGRWLNGHPAGLQKKLLLAAGIAANLGVLLYFKYAGFLVANLDLLLGSTYSLGAIVLPLGISFITFQKIAYLVDAYRGHARDPSFIRFALFVSFFPQLIAGPIVHHAEIMPQLLPSRLKGVRAATLAAGLCLFALGMFKKVILADGIAPDANLAFADAAKSIEPGLSAAWAGALAYTLQLYFDFSGYSDMACRACPAVRRPAAAEFLLALQGRRHHRLLAPLAHHPVALPARLSLHSPGRQPARPGAALSSTSSSP